MKTILNLILVLLISSTSIAQQYFGTTTFGDGSIESTYHHATDSQGNVYTVGLYSGSITLGSTTINYAGGNADGYLAKFGSDGTPIWIEGFGGFMDDVVTDVAIDSNDNIYLTGYFMGAGPNAFDADPGPGVFRLEQPSPIASRDCFIIKLDNNGDFVWAKQVSNPAGGAANEDSKSIEVDAAGNVYVAGAFTYADFDPDPTVSLDLFSADGNSQDPFLLKLDNDGNFVSVKTFDAPGGAAKIEDMELLDDGEILISGGFQSTIDLDPNTGSQIQTTNGGYDTFMAKLDSSENLVWGNSFGGAGLEINRFIKNMDSGIYVGGLIATGADLDPGTGVNTITTNGDYDGYYSVFDANGTYQSSYVVGGEGNVNLEEAYDITTGPNGNLFVTGSYIGTADFDYGNGTATTTSNGNSDNYLIEIATDGTYQNHWTVGGTDAENAPQIVFNSNDEVLTIGSFKSVNMDFNPFAGEDLKSSVGESDIYFSRYTFEPLGIEENQVDSFTVYPNPAHNIVNLKAKANIENIAVYNLLGQQVILKKNNSNAMELNISNLSTGTYIMKVAVNGVVGTYKLMKN